MNRLAEGLEQLAQLAPVDKRLVLVLVDREGNVADSGVMAQHTGPEDMYDLLCYSLAACAAMLPEEVVTHVTEQVDTIRQLVAEGAPAVAEAG